MKRTINPILSILLIAILFVSCDKNPSLQSYFVDNQESASFISQDIPITMLKIDESKFDEDQKEAYKSVKRLNFLGYKANGDENDEKLKAEITKVKAILSDSKYNDLIEFSDKGNKVVVKYIGTDEDADEVVIFGSSKDMGFGIVRILGDDMNPEKMSTLTGVLQSANVDGEQIKDIMNFFK